ncbi:helix-turn-helix transcriptional regulator [Burkholderia multivorans]|uniref:helix-turn-helix domain-containing protein n=1 Tax=Burkholderia multivorans TaxID=87883 RepID=UPI0005BB7B48|nr:helix-turn-helix transcriptional regulator [Burkholderia multivorans]MBJ9655230.1 helix-turn-helix transcriptional regulator [Burkholderia multivorans]MBR7922040.1 helix-turn-helix transcriptional regulator [Burkholderia multivorans]MBU9148122.1 helix-turn-helix domain-containing protein [Burkholderia multivorans]MBU9481413.1 helix-turn-helix domain-containing protein [Burkholderia multivorans]MCA8505025.1 helix-turn-helix domain-containing protein [Burkholderia multivorans]
MTTRPTSPTDDAEDALLAARVGTAIAEQRRARGLTQAKLAEMIDLEQEAISRWERGTRMPTLHRLQQLSDALDCSVDQLLQRGSKRPDDQLAMIANALNGLDSDERELVVNFVQQFADMLKAKHPAKKQGRK